MKKFSMNGFLLVILFAVWAVPGPFCIAEEKFPAKPITMIIGMGAGGMADVAQRYLASFSSKILAQPMVVINRTGGGGAVALGELKNAKPDGHTIGVMSTGGVISALMRKVPYHPVQDFEAITQTVSIDYGLVVKDDSPFKTLKDLIAYAKANPYKVTYSTSGAGTPQHLVMMLLGEEAKVEWIHVPMSSGVTAITALLGGHVTCCAQTTTWKPYVEAGRLRALASFMEERIDFCPDVPTLVELGYKIVAPEFMGIVGPKGIPKDRVQILDDFFRKGTETSGFQEVLNKFGAKTFYRNPEVLKKNIKELYEKVGKIIEQHGEELKK